MRLNGDEIEVIPDGPVPQAQDLYYDENGEEWISVTPAEKEELERIPARKIPKVLERIRKRHVREALAAKNGDQARARAARGVGVSRSVRRRRDHSGTSGPPDPSEATPAKGRPLPILKARWVMEPQYRRIRFLVADPTEDTGWKWVGEWRVEGDRSVESWAEERRRAVRDARKHLKDAYPDQPIELIEWNYSKDGTPPETKYPTAEEAPGEAPGEAQDEN